METGLTAQEKLDFEIMYAKIVINYDLKSLVGENAAIGRLTDLKAIPVYDYVEQICRNNKYARNAKYDFENTVQRAYGALKETIDQSSLFALIKSFYYKNMSYIFDLHYYTGDDSLKYFENDKEDENGIPCYFPDNLKQFISDAYPVFDKIRNTPQSRAFTDKIFSLSDKKMYEWTRVNCSNVLTLIFLEKIIDGDDITKLLYERIPSALQMPDTFKKLCRITNGKYIIINTDYSTLDFQIAVFDLIDFIDYENKLLFNNKINQYIKTL